jgi:hypothetical protein
MKKVTGEIYKEAVFAFAAIAEKHKLETPEGLSMLQTLTMQIAIESGCTFEEYEEIIIGGMKLTKKLYKEMIEK